ncbi:MAG: hypothetical protein ACI36T_04580 [Eggerthellaceae bacterium]
MNDCREMRILGARYRVATTGITRRDIENAGESKLAQWISYAAFELELALSYGRNDIADEVSEAIKQMRAQQAINAARCSIENSCMCGMIC